MGKQLKFGFIDIYSKDNILNTYSVRISQEYMKYYSLKYHKHIKGGNFIFNKIHIVEKTEIYDIYTKELNLFMRFLVYIGLKKY